jgi:hypothetical protein
MLSHSPTLVSSVGSWSSSTQLGSITLHNSEPNTFFTILELEFFPCLCPLVESTKFLCCTIPSLNNNPAWCNYWAHKMEIPKFSTYKCVTPHHTPTCWIDSTWLRGKLDISSHLFSSLHDHNPNFRPRWKEMFDWPTPNLDPTPP